MPKGWQEKWAKTQHHLSGLSERSMKTRLALLIEVGLPSSLAQVANPLLQTVREPMELL